MHCGLAAVVRSLMFQFKSIVDYSLRAIFDFQMHDASFLVHDKITSVNKNYQIAKH